MLCQLQIHVHSTKPWIAIIAYDTTPFYPRGYLRFLTATTPRIQTSNFRSCVPLLYVPVVTPSTQASYRWRSSILKEQRAYVHFFSVYPRHRNCNCDVLPHPHIPQPHNVRGVKHSHCLHAVKRPFPLARSWPFERGKHRQK